MVDSPRHWGAAGDRVRADSSRSKDRASHSADFDGDTFPDLVTATERAAPSAAQPNALVRRLGAATAVFGDAVAAVTLNITPYHVTSGVI